MYLNIQFGHPVLEVALELFGSERSTRNSNVCQSVCVCLSVCQNYALELSRTPQESPKSLQTYLRGLAKRGS